MSRTRFWLVCTAVVAVLGGLVAVAYFTPLMAVRTIAVSGVTATSGLSDDQIRQQAQIPSGRPLLQINTAQAASRVAAISAVESARVRRKYPSTIEVIVVERMPVVRVETERATTVLDRLGVGYRHYDRGTAVPADVRRLPQLDTPNVGPTDPATTAALHIVVELPDDLRASIATVRAQSPVDIAFILRNGTTVVFGDGTRVGDKAIAWRAITTRKGTLYNVSSPDLPSYR
ncbi:FtsQ-type POTRA domain-containing protein [Gordonia sp. X0973]|uniref:cell division protein FtsQ/DivIB n=1 Tax=Gordonia sp. X0973 TaxID=2742602 RepID=UPI000F5338DC|nr:FtsQ-type POTRA domain-containing protein [Gordonia sp. X0973]QKT07576.1 FtsQ-type POTRA domain-containing protein [Gordonia sp. X0973]